MGDGGYDDVINMATPRWWRHVGVYILTGSLSASQQGLLWQFWVVTIKSAKLGARIGVRNVGVTSTVTPHFPPYPLVLLHDHSSSTSLSKPFLEFFPLIYVPLCFSPFSRWFVFPSVLRLLFPFVSPPYLLHFFVFPSPLLRQKHYF